MCLAVKPIKATLHKYLVGRVRCYGLYLDDNALWKFKLYTNPLFPGLSECCIIMLWAYPSKKKKGVSYRTKFSKAANQVDLAPKLLYFLEVKRLNLFWLLGLTFDDDKFLYFKTALFQIVVLWILPFRLIYLLIPF